MIAHRTQAKADELLDRLGEIAARATGENLFSDIDALRHGVLTTANLGLPRSSSAAVRPPQRVYRQAARFSRCGCRQLFYLLASDKGGAPLRQSGGRH